MLRGGTATCVYFTDAVMVKKSTVLSQSRSPHGAHSRTHMQPIVTSWYDQAMRADVILILLTLVIKTGFAAS